jgi:hypothetical protein
MKLTRAWAVDAGERISGTFVAAFLGALVISTGAGVTLPAVQAAALAGLGAAVTLAKSIAGAYIGSPNSASILPSVGKVPVSPVAESVAPMPLASYASGDLTMLNTRTFEQIGDWPFYHAPGAKPSYPLASLKPIYPNLRPPSAPARRIPADRITPLHPLG